MADRPRLPRALVAALVLGVALTGCSPAYVARAAWEEAKFLWRRTPIERILAAPDLEPSQRSKLELVLEVRRFAGEELGLSVGGAYGSISPVDGSALVHVVSAARRDRLQRYTWWFPIVGRVPYKGFFSERSAKRLAQALEADGYDTDRRTATAFSTLGWFDDPLPSTLLERGELALVNTILHELFHNTLFLKGAVVFNESAANFVGHRGAIEFYCRPPGDATLCSQAVRQWDDARTIGRFLEKVLEELGVFYRSRPSPEELEAGRRRMFDSIRERFGELEIHRSRYVKGQSHAPLNNATLLHDRIYFHSLDRFEVLYQMKGSSLRSSIEAIREIAGAREKPFDGLEQMTGAGSGLEVLELADTDPGRGDEDADVQHDDGES